MKNEKKIKALAQFLDNSDLVEVEELIEDEDYLVLTDDEADEKAKENILESVWAFKAEFLESHTGLDAEIISTIQNAKNEDANEPLKRLLKSEERFVQDAISSDGRGHFISGYDGHENEQGGFYIYRIN